jgi:hypothetical protein
MTNKWRIEHCSPITGGKWEPYHSANHPDELRDILESLPTMAPEFKHGQFAFRLGKGRNSLDACDGRNWWEYRIVHGATADKRDQKEAST